MAAGAVALVLRPFQPRMQDRPSPDPIRGGKPSQHSIRRRVKASHKAAARRVLESAAPVRDLRDSIRGRVRATPAPRTVRSDLPAPPALDAPPGPVLLAIPASQPVAFAPPAAAVLARAEHRTSLLADRLLLDRVEGLEPPPAAPVAALAPAPPPREAELLDYQTRLVNLERFATGLASLADTQAHALWAANARLAALEPGSLPLASWVDAAAARPPVVWPGDGRSAPIAPRPDPAAASLTGSDSSSLRVPALPAYTLAAARGQDALLPRGRDAVPPWAGDSRAVVFGPPPPGSGPASSRPSPSDSGAAARRIRPRPNPPGPD